MAAYINSTYVDNVLTETTRRALTDVSSGADGVLDQFIAAATASVIDAVKNQGRQPPANLTAIDALSDDDEAKQILKQATLVLVVVALYARKQIPVTQAVADQIGPAHRVEAIRNGQVQLTTLAANARDAVGGVASTPTDESLASSTVIPRPNIFKSLRGAF
jgi:hypothetical protein